MGWPRLPRVAGLSGRDIRSWLTEATRRGVETAADGFKPTNDDLLLISLYFLMVHRPSDSRLLNSLLSNEKEYHKQLLVLLDNYSQQSLGAFAAYASASPAHVARAVIAVAGSFAGADDALRRYAVSIEAWQAELRALKDLEEDVGSIIRDREILFVRLFSQTFAFLFSLPLTTQIRFGLA
jgi:hypothetical protein